MFAAILIAVLASHGIPASHIAGVVVIDGRPGCTATGLYSDPTRPVVVCAK